MEKREKGNQTERKRPEGESIERKKVVEPPSLKYSRDCLVVRSESTLRDKRRVWSCRWLPQGLLILWKSAPSRHIRNLPVSGETSSKFRVDIRLITCVSLPIHFRAGTASSLENFFPRAVRDLRLSEWDSQWFRLNDPSSRRSISSRANCRWISSGEEHSSDVLFIFLIITVAHENTLTLLETFYEYKKFRSIDSSDEVETILRKKNQSNFKNMFNICNLLSSY